MDLEQGRTSSLVSGRELVKRDRKGGLAMRTKQGYDYTNNIKEHRGRKA